MHNKSTGRTMSDNPLNTPLPVISRHQINPDKPLPTITDRKIVARTRFFGVEQVDLTFANGQTREVERMAGKDK